MSSGPLDLPVLISAIPHVQKLANAEARSAEIKRELFSPLLSKKIQQNQEKIQVVEPQEATEPVNRDGGQNQPRQEFHSRKKHEEDEEKQETVSSNPSPWAGNIVNVKI